MTYDESNAKLTTELTGRTVDYVERQDKEIRICTTCGHVITLQADANGDIMYKSTSVSIILEGLEAGNQQGVF